MRCRLESAVYEPTADELDCEEEMQARAATTIGHVRARVAVGLDARRAATKAVHDLI